MRSLPLNAARGNGDRVGGVFTVEERRGADRALLMFPRLVRFALSPLLCIETGLLCSRDVRPCFASMSAIGVSPQIFRITGLDDASGRPRSSLLGAGENLVLAERLT